MTNSEPNFVDFLRRRAARHAALHNDVVVDYLKMVIKPGDKTLQLGACDLGSIFVRRGAFHEVTGSGKIKADMLRYCEKNKISTGRLAISRSQEKTAGPSSLDTVILGANLEFSLLAGQWQGVSDRLKIGGVLILTGADTSSSARLTDALMHDAGWALQELINGEVAVFRKTAQSTNKMSAKRLVASTEPKAKIPAAQPGLVAGALRFLFGGLGSQPTSSAS